MIGSVRSISDPNRKRFVKETAPTGLSVLEELRAYIQANGVFKRADLDLIAEELRLPLLSVQGDVAKALKYGLLIEKNECLYCPLILADNKHLEEKRKIWRERKQALRGSRGLPENPGDSPGVSQGLKDSEPEPEENQNQKEGGAGETNPAHEPFGFEGQRLKFSRDQFLSWSINHFNGDEGKAREFLVRIDHTLNGKGMAVTGDHLSYAIQWKITHKEFMKGRDLDAFEREKAKQSQGRPRPKEFIPHIEPPAPEAIVAKFKKDVARLTRERSELEQNS